MKLVVLGCPTHRADDVQRVLARYDSQRQITTIDCDVDIVTLGIAVAVLQDQFDTWLRRCPEDLADQIRKTTKEALDQYA